MKPFHQSIPTNVPNRQSGRVMVVDDDPVARMILSRWMEIWDLQGSYFGDATSAFVPSQQVGFALAIIDFNLPDMNGIDLIRLIRNASRTNRFRCPVFALHTTDSDVRELARRENVEFFLQKPLTSSDLLLTIKEAGCNPRTSECEVADLNRATQLRVSLRSNSKSIMPIR